ncbi:hypothetical protein MNBD_ACTINO01-1071 [hydrothermal vent metagenome]|uniref:RecA protein n=1 Tax=hydrothermal vent metagenome TaxID=652676 RepID=A0A3B0S094_9ZZZZ
MVVHLERISEPIHERSVALGGVYDSIFTLAPGQIAGLSGLPGSGLTRLGLTMLAPHTERGPLVYLDVRGWANPRAAWELGIDPEHFIVVHTESVVMWARAVATLLDGVRAVYAEVPHGVKDSVIRTLAARARTRRTPLVLRPLDGRLPQGILHLHLEAREVIWEGTDRGHGVLERRFALFEASGKAMRGRERTIEVEDNGTNDLRVVPHMGTQTTERLA